MISNVQMNQPRTLLSFLVIAFLIGCSSEPTISPKLEQAVKSVEYMTTKRHLARSAFGVYHPEQKPSDFVEYMFSTMGSAEWPVAFDDFEEEQLRSINVPIMPNDIPIEPNNPNPEYTMQVVVKADDEAGLVIIEAYEGSATTPVLVVQRTIWE